jgi:putative spermidine/putrescine transport system permease protein
MTTTLAPSTRARPRRADTGRWRRWRRSGLDGVVLAAIPAVALMALLFLYPFFYGVAISFQPLTGGGAFENYSHFFSDSYLRKTIWLTIRLAVPGAVISLLIAVPLAYRMRREFRGKRLVTLIFLLPVTFGSVLMAEGMTQIFSPRGWINLILGKLGIGPVTFLYSYQASLIALVLTILPFGLLLMIGFFGGVDPSLEEAAATLGASRATRFWRISFPLVIPGLVTTLSLALVESFAVFPSAVLIGQPDAATHVLSIPIYQAASQRFDYSAASAIAMVLAVVELVVLALLALVRGRLYRGPAVGGKG